MADKLDKVASGLKDVSDASGAVVRGLEEVNNAILKSGDGIGAFSNSFDQAAKLGLAPEESEEKKHKRRS
jgi:hypothetical protein